MNHWICTKCNWQGKYENTTSRMYRGINWQNCPLCDAVAIPTSGSASQIVMPADRCSCGGKWRTDGVHQNTFCSECFKTRT